MTSTAAVVSTADFVLYIYHRWRDWLAVLDIRDRRFATTAQRLHTLNRTPTLSHSHTQAHTDAHTHTHTQTRTGVYEMGESKRKQKKETFLVFWFVSTRLLALPFLFSNSPATCGDAHTHTHNWEKKIGSRFPCLRCDWR